MRLVVESCGVTTLTLLVLAFGLSPGDIGDVTTPSSGCEVCASTGDCSHAFRDGLGQFCGNWMDRWSHDQPCCCPLNAVCNVSPADYVCTCAYVGAMPPYHSESDLMNRVLWMWWILGMLVVLAVCGGCGYFVVKRMVSRSDESCTFVPPAMTVPLVSPSREALYGSTGQMSMGAFTPETEGAEAEAGAGVDPATGAALGASAGLLGGVVLASHDAPFNDLEVAGDGFDGGLGSLEKVDEAGEDEHVEAEEEVALLTVVPEGE
ncbi:hypothetical protein PF010_g24178 [Phytophthora fragariae]|uniref:EGF-like domain-containing protein n=2 Tax=Phytophthora fragariae TaxID=53985 RepID=A0A6A3I6Q7_9STRA|nr:hypothetical protein PF009_g25439 [Phytophthora fragariae]KAE8978659.1 hypothetical protein PF011_g23153 [Phytophthora fragariae]KAE9075767.1 hypothetical protein PF010_g24178 [Phytophthora fragariae]KAE9076377.1 hypothetical protein PF007_g24643 [Phytophthora fragariae]